MKKIIIYTITGITCLTLSFYWTLVHNKVQKPEISFKTAPIKAAAIIGAAKLVAPNKTAPNIAAANIVASSIGGAKIIVAAKASSAKKIADNTEAIKEAATKKAPAKKEILKKAITKNISRNNLNLKKVSFEELPGWNNADVKNSLLAFQTSCKVFLKQKPSHPVGSHYINLHAKDWHPACKAALLIDSISEATARTFFEKWFNPVEFAKKEKHIHSLFTGYYMPQLKGSLTRTEKYNTPIYGLPKDLKWKKPNYTREQIDNGVLKRKAPVIAWIDSPAERQFLEIEGSGVIKLTSGKNLYLGYAGENGAPYTSIGGVLIKNGIMTKHNASKRAIISYLKNHPSRANTILHRNKSFVFFENLKQPVALGVKGIALTPGYSLAIDRKWIPIGAPLWLATKSPQAQSDKEKKFQRLMIAQDTGGAIRGLMRGDVFWGSGKKARFLGEHMKNEGRYWLLLPKHLFDRFSV